MSLSFLVKFLETTKFTTAKTDRNFIPRRIGLGYDLVYEFNEQEIVKECKKKGKKKIIIQQNKEVDEEEVSKIGLIKRRK